MQVDHLPRSDLAALREEMRRDDKILIMGEDIGAVRRAIQDLPGACSRSSGRIAGARYADR